MIELEIKQTEKSPKFILNTKSGVIKLLGRSTMLHPIDFYAPLITLLEEYSKNSAKKTQFIIDLEYYNTLSSKYILSLLHLVANINQQQKEVEIIWNFEEEDFGIKEDIEMFSEIINHKIHTIECVLI